MRRWARALAVLGTTALLGSASTTGPASAVECDQRCQVERAWAAQEDNALPLTPFYDTSGVQRAPAGSLVRSEAAEGYRLDEGMRATRILYHSRDSRGRDVVTSGVVLRPAGEPPAGGWPMVVDAHGASGVGRVCAPSLMKDIWYGGHLRLLVRAGHAVVATDYAGLGAGSGRPEFLSKIAEANDTYYALPAARQAVPGLGARWVALGHSQGGHAVLAVDELVARSKKRGGDEAGYLGSVAVAPVSGMAGAVARLASSPEGAGMIPMIVRGTRHEADVLTPEALVRSSTLDTGCLNVTVAVYRDLTGERLVRPEGWRRLAHLLRDDEPGTGPVAGPLLIQQGTADALVTEQDTARLVDRLSRHDVPVTYRTYAGLDHNGVLIPSSRDALAWIADRFANRPLPTRG